MNYKEFAFKATIPNTLTTNYLIGNSGSGAFIETENGIKKFENEDKAISYLLSNLDLSGKYDFVDVFYNPSYEQQSEDGKKYDKYIMVIIRKTNAVHNQLFKYLTSPINNDGMLIAGEVENLNQELDLTHIQGLGLEIIMQDRKEVNDKTLYDVRDNFIYGFLNKKITCDSLYHYIIEQGNKTRKGFDIAVIDVTGSELKSTFRDEIIVDSSLDIYREFIGGTTKTDEEIHQDEVNADNEANMNKPNDSDYI